MPSIDPAGRRKLALSIRPDAAARRRIPLTAADPTANGFPAPAGEDVLLVRPDQHIAWLGRPGADPGEALDLAIRGFAATS